MRPLALVALSCFTACQTAPAPTTPPRGPSATLPPALERGADAAPAPQREATVGPRAGQWEATLGGSGANNQDFDFGSFSAGGSAGYFLSDEFELGVRQTVGFADTGRSTWNGVTRVFADWHIPLGRLYPFIGANFGWVYGDTVDETLAGAPEAGFKYFLKDDAFLQATAEYQFFFEDTESFGDGFEDGQFVYSLGFGLLF
ncbi:MAG: hypothetical protein AAF628_12770 [Planctomycetota bacterium]